MVRAAFALVLAWSLTTASGYVFRWVDPQGDLHVTDRLNDVPEPYRSMYAAQVKRLEEEKAKGKGKGRSEGRETSRPPRSPAPATSAKPRGSSFVDRELARQKHWRDLVARWRAELSGAIAVLEKIDEELAQARLNPILRTTPPVKAKIVELEERRALAFHKLEAARRMLLETIPARARKEQVPPKWLL